jgi:hypothetical protein
MPVTSALEVSHQGLRTQGQVSKENGRDRYDLDMKDKIHSGKGPQIF